MSKPTLSQSEEIREVVDVLGCQLFIPANDFKENLPAFATTPSTQLEPKKTDPYAPGYSMKSELQAKPSKRRRNPSPESDGETQLMRDDDFIDDADLSGVSEDEQPQKRRKRAPGRPPKDRSSEEALFAEVEVYDENSEPDPNRDDIVKDFLSCHSCHQSGFSSVMHIVLHMQQVHYWNHQLDHCVYCDTPFMAKSVCCKHEKDKCWNVDLICYKCGERQKDKEAFLKHLVVQHRHGIRRKCPHCEINFLTLAPMWMNRWPHTEVCKTRHSSRNKQDRGDSLERTCSECGGSYSDAWKHRKQCTVANRDIKFECNECRKGFRRIGTLKKHFRLVKECKENAENQTEFHSIMKYVDSNVNGMTTCPDCGMEFSSKKGPLEHRKNCSAFTRFKCNVCNRGMNVLDGFNIHFSKYPACRQAKENKEIVAELMARSIKPDFHVCHLCGANYKTKESIDKHMLTHADNVQYFYCSEVECGKRFLTSKSLEAHMRHHTMPMVICSICGKQVKQGSLSLHMVLHTGKKVSCPICSKLFQHKGVLNKHLKSCHLGKKTKEPKKRKAGVKGKNEGKDNPVMEPMMQTIQVELADGAQNAVMKVSLPQLQEGIDSRQVVGLVSQGGQIVGHAVLDGQTQNVEPLGAGGQPVLLPGQYQRIVVPSTVDIQQFIQNN